MKNKNSFILAAILACVVAISIFFFAGGARGMSAYQVAVKNGFKGSETEWLNSLKGTDGKDAEPLDYAALYASAKQSGEVSEDTTYLQFLQDYIVKNSTSESSSLALAIQNSIKSSVSIYVKSRSGGSVSGGAGTIFDIDEYGNAKIVTNYHVTYTGYNFNDIYILPYEDNYLTYTYNSGFALINVLENMGDHTIKATYIGGSKIHDIAVLEVKNNARLAKLYADQSLDKVTLANSLYEPVAGTTCYAIGNPLGEGMSATQGVVSVPYEQVYVEDVENADSAFMMRAIRVTCAINGGNSGGGLFNYKGELIGVINSRRYTVSNIDQTDVDGFGFAIPLSVTKNIVNKIIAECNGITKTQPTLYAFGINYNIVDCKANYNSSTGKITTTETIKVDSVETNSYAKAAGLKSGDILNSVTVNYKDGTTVTSQINHYYTLSDIMLTISSGDKITVNVTRPSVGNIDSNIVTF